MNHYAACQSPNRADTSPASGKRWLLGVGLLGWMAFACGCAQQPETTKNAPAAPTSRAQADVDLDSTQRIHPAVKNSPLVGTWLGKAILNEDTLRSVRDGLTGDERNQLMREAQTFVSTQMAIDFSPTGNVETAVEVQPFGQAVIAGQTYGTWRVIRARNTDVLIETTEIDEDGTPYVNRATYLVSSDGNRIALQPTVGAALSKCEPLICLDRQSLSMPSASMARSNEADPLR